MTRRHRESERNRLSQTQRQEEDQMDNDVRDAIFKVMIVFTNKKAMDDSFIDGLTSQQYAALRDLNILRIDSGDSRIPEDWTLDECGRLLED